MENKNKLDEILKLFTTKVLWTTIGVLLFVVVIGSVDWWYELKKEAAITQIAPTLRSEQSDVPSDWKTYTNTEYGFEFKYPNDLEIYLDPHAVGFISAETKQKMENPLFEGDIDLWFSWESYLNTADPQSVNKEAINGYEFTYYSGGQGGHETGNYEIKSGENVLTFSGNPKIILPVLSTIKINEYSIVTTGFYKKFISYKYGYEFIFPNEYWQVRSVGDRTSAYLANEENGTVYVEFEIAAENIGRESVFDIGANVPIEETKFAGFSAKRYECPRMIKCPNQLIETISIQLTNYPSSWGEDNEINLDVYNGGEGALIDANKLLSTFKFAN